MKRYLLFIMFLVACGAVKRDAPAEGVGERTHLSDGVTVTLERWVYAKQYVNAFTAEDLYKSRERALRRGRSRAAAATVYSGVEAGGVMPETTESPDVRRIVEIVQVIDENGGVLASKRMK